MGTVTGDGNENEEKNDRESRLRLPGLSNTGSNNDSRSVENSE